MTYSLLWLPDVLRNVGLTVTEETGWKTRGHGNVGPTKGVLCHHTAGPPTGNTPSLNTVIHGRPDLPGPLAQLFLARDGTFHVVAAGLCYHAGKGIWEGITSGNTSFVGIEAENTGLPDDFPWPSCQMTSYAKGVAAILLHIRAKPIMCAGHFEYARPVGRKGDPSFAIGGRDVLEKAMTAFRATVANIMIQHDPDSGEGQADDSD